MTFRVVIAAQDISFPCETGESVLDAAERAGYSLPYSCRRGVCSTCEGELCGGTAVLGSKLVTGATSDVLLCQTKPRSDLLVRPKRIERSDPPARKIVVVSVYRITRPAEDVAILNLRFPAGIRAKFKAGQHLRVQLPDDDTRIFSMANPPQESDGVQLHIRRMPGGQLSEKLLSALAPRDMLQVEIPFGDFHLRAESAKPIVGLATGTGFAPLKSMIEDLIRRKNAREMRFYWGGRHRSDLYLAELAEKWAARESWFKFIPVLSEPDDAWNGRKGLVHTAALGDIADVSGWQVYACGNPVMVRNARRDFTRAGLPENEFFGEAFVPSGNIAG